MRRDHSGVRTNSVYYTEMKEKWELLYDLMGGTKEMRKAGKRWLPQNPKESDTQYAARMNMTFLYNAYKRTIKAYKGEAFKNDITVSNIPPELEYLVEDFDGCGRSVTSVAAEMLEHLLITGKANPVVDFPKTDGPVSVSDFKYKKIRPYVNPIDPRDLIGWRVVNENGKEIITEVRFVERTIEIADEFYDLEVERVRMITPTEFRTFKQMVNDGKITGEYEELGDYVTENTLGKIPIVPIYENKIATLVSDPPLEDLAWLNLRHWQSSSEQNNILHVARVPILFGKGMNVDNIEVGTNSAVISENENSDLKYVEHTGNSIGAGRTDLKDLEERMGHMGSDILSSKSVARQTATSRKIDQSESLSVFQVILRNLERGIEECFKLAGEWVNVDASGVSVSIGNDISIPPSANPVDDIVKLREAEILDEGEDVEEAKRRGIISPHVSE